MYSNPNITLVDDGKAFGTYFKNSLFFKNDPRVLVGDKLPRSENWIRFGDFTDATDTICVRSCYPKVARIEIGANP